jgi:hypothetical protein
MSYETTPRVSFAFSLFILLWSGYSQRFVLEQWHSNCAALNPRVSWGACKYFTVMLKSVNIIFIIFNGIFIFLLFCVQS